MGASHSNFTRNEVKESNKGKLISSLIHSLLTHLHCWVHGESYALIAWLGHSGGGGVAGGLRLSVFVGASRVGLWE